eukprot:COSAG06_NODE_17014_length_967_cov_0.547235_2_plen_104_part_00
MEAKHNVGSFAGEEEIEDDGSAWVQECVLTVLRVEHLPACMDGDFDAMVAAFWSNMKTVFEAVIARRKFSWQLMWTGQNPDDPQRNVADTCPGKETRLFAPFM